MENTLKTKTIELPTFDQLTDDEKQKVLENYYDINVDSSFWYEHIKDEAETLGFEIKNFDLDRNSLEIKTIVDVLDIAENIIKEHGETCETHSTAKNFVDAFNALPVNEDGEVIDENELDTIRDDFRIELAQDYMRILQKDYKHLTSAEAIAETLIINKYTFNRETLKIDS